VKIRYPSELARASFCALRRWLDARTTSLGEIVIFLGRTERLDIIR
jgi:hypothetical protein